MALGKIWKYKNHLLESIGDIQNVFLGVNLLYHNNLIKTFLIAFLFFASLPIANVLSIDSKVLGQRVQRISRLVYFAYMKIVIEYGFRITLLLK